MMKVVNGNMIIENHLWDLTIAPSHKLDKSTMLWETERMCTKLKVDKVKVQIPKKMNNKSIEST